MNNNSQTGIPITNRLQELFIIVLFDQLEV
jgi:hypothetical protein